MTTQRKAMELALEALEVGFMGPNIVKYNQAITAIKEALAEPEQEPVAWYDTEEYGNIRWASEWSLDEGTPFYTTPPQRTWVGLTDEDVEMIVENRRAAHWEFVHQVEALLKEKNNA